MVDGSRRVADGSGVPRCDGCRLRHWQQRGRWVGRGAPPHRWGKLAGVCCVDRSRLNGPAARELEALQRGGVQVSSELRLDGASAIVDAIFGTGVSKRPQGRVAARARTLNYSGPPVISPVL